MKRDFLKSLDLPDGTIDTIMAEYGKSTNALRAELVESEQKAQGLAKQFETAQSTISDLQSKAEQGSELSTQIEAYQKQIAELEAGRAQDKLDFYVDGALKEAGSRNNKALKALLDFDKITEQDGKYTGLDEQLEAIKSEAGYLFESDEPKAPIVTSPGNPGTEGGGNDPFAALADKYN